MSVKVSSVFSEEDEKEGQLQLNGGLEAVIIKLY
jgi:hypothetical protein